MAQEEKPRESDVTRNQKAAVRFVGILLLTAVVVWWLRSQSVGPSEVPSIPPPTIPQPQPESQPAPNPPPTASVQQKILVPGSQDRFCIAIQHFRAMYQAAEERKANEAELSDLRFRRKEALTSLFALPSMENGSAKNWIGILKRISTNTEGTAKLTVLLDCDGATGRIELRSYEGLAHGAPLYPVLIKLHENQVINFSGTVITAEQRTDYVAEVSMTEEGSMINPDIRFAFTDFHAL
jgi:hypothetical protein